MLDECKGERLEEVLAVFSSAVLKKLVAELQLNEPSHPALAQTLALENRGYSGQTTDLSVLALAHRASLSRHLRDKSAARARFSDLSELLDLKERSLARRREQAKILEAQQRESGALDKIDDDVKSGVWRTVRNNWSGNEQWMETLLYGDMHSRKDGLLSTPFGTVWRRVQAGRLAELEDHLDGLLQQMDRRVKAHKERLEKWQQFRSDIVGTASGRATGDEPKQSDRQKGIDLGFGAHENLHIGRLSPRKLPRGKPGELTDEYSEIIDGLQQELAQLSKGPTTGSFLGMRPKAKMGDHHLEPPSEEIISEISELEEEDQGASANQGSSVSPIDPDTVVSSDRGGNVVLKKTRSVEDEQTLEPQRPSTIQRQAASPITEEPPPIHTSPIRANCRPTTPVSRSPVRRTPSPVKASPPKLSTARPVQASPEKAVSPTQALADQILASMNTASPSPVKKPRHILSLAERTRLSMARRNSKGPSLDDDDDEPELGTLSLRPPSSANSISEVKPAAQNGTLKTPTEEPEERGYEDLVARTRRSMAGFEAAREKAQLERRRSQRKSRHIAASGHRRDGSSYFPSVGEEVGDTTLLAEELMNNEQDDYEAVFKSRPKIKTSPVASPVKEWAD
jgi:hypothetical protein